MACYKRILYLGWLGQGNVGDDVLFTHFKSLLYSHLAESRASTVVDIDGWIPVPGYHLDLHGYDLVVLGGGSLFTLEYWLSICKAAQDQSIPVVSWGTGIDGKFTTPVRDFKSAVTVPGQLAIKIRSIASRMAYLSCRGPYTRALLEAVGVDPAQIHEIGDPALSFSHLAKDGSATQSRRIFVNWGTSLNNVIGGNESHVEIELAAAIHTLIGDGYEAVIVPFWVKDIDPSKSLAAQLPSSHVSCLDVVLGPEKICDLLRESLFSINLKLHASILSAAVGRPFVHLAYRSKCFDFAETVGCRALCIPTDEAERSTIINRIRMVERDYDVIKSTISDAQRSASSRITDSVARICQILDLGFN